MLELSNLRKVQNGEWTKLMVDVSRDKDMDIPDNFWFAVKNENADMFADDVYDAFMIVPFYIAMYYNTDLRIHGLVSKKLYKNLTTYFERILRNFSQKFSPAKIIVDGFKTADITYDGGGGIIGAGLSCGVDSLSTIYDHYVNENDPDYKINALFFSTCGQHGKFGTEQTQKLFHDRWELVKKAADDIGLPLYVIDTNLYSFAPFPYKSNIEIFCSLYSCYISLQRVMKKYYCASGTSYDGVIEFGRYMHEKDFAEFSETYAIHLLSTERIELVNDGSQYERTEKTERISDWDIAQRHLNVCSANISAENCSVCGKCLRTLIPLEAMGKLDKFSGVFDLDKYRKVSESAKCTLVLNKDNDAFLADNYNFAVKHGMKLLSERSIRVNSFIRSCVRKILPVPVRKIIKKVIGKK